MKFIFKIIISTIILYGLIGCNNDNNYKESDINYKFKNNSMLIESVVNTIIKPEVLQLELATTKLKKITQQFITETSFNNLQSLKKQWLVVAQQYAINYVFNIGEVKDNYYALKINNWPTKNQSIENFILNKDINLESIAQLGSSSKGIPALEYLFFSESESEVVQKFSTNPKRKDFLMFIVNELENNAKQQRISWDNYASKIISNQGEGINDSFNLLFNGLNNAIHYAWETKIGKPAGLTNKTLKNTDKLEARFSKKSIVLIKKNIDAVYNIYFSNKVISVSDKVRYITKNDKLNEIVKNQFNKVYSIINTIEPSLLNAITQNHKSVKELYDELKRLEIILTTDVKSALSIIITGTDGDGD